MKKMRILFITSFFYPHIGGSQRYMEELYGYLIKKHKNITADVLCYNTDNASSKEIYNGLTIYRIPCWQIIKGRFNLPNPIALIFKLFQLSRNRYDVVHTHLRFFDTAWWTWIYANLVGAKSIFTEHVAITPVYQSKLVEFVAQFIDATVARWTVSKYDVLTTTNNSTKNFLEEELQVKKAITIMYGGVDSKFFSPQKKNSRVIPRIKVRFKQNDVIVTFVGRLIWTKGVTYLYEAIKQLHKKLPKNVYFVLAGGGELDFLLQESIQRDKLINRILLTGSLHKQKVRDLLRISNIVIHPSHHNEGFPNVILEAGATGCFVIATDNAGTSEIIKNKENGLLIEQENIFAIKKALVWALENTRTRKEMAKRLRQRIVRKFDWSKISEEFYNILNT